jgi:proteasome regulatory subunit
VPLPDEKGRYEIFMIHTRKMNLAKDVSLSQLAKITEGFSGADIKAACVEAGYNAIRNERDVVTMKDFLDAVEKIKARKASSETEMQLPRDVRTML